MATRTKHTYLDGCNAEHPWVREVKRVMENLFQSHRGFDTVVWLSNDNIEVLPLKYIQYQNGLIVYKRDGISTECYGELIKLFAVFVDHYYNIHGNYYNFLDSLRKMQSIRFQSPTLFSFTADILDSFYMAVMSGKYADRNKEVDLHQTPLSDIFPDIQRGYDSFATIPFLSIESACFHSVLKRFYNVSMEIETPTYQSGRLILERVEDIVSEAVKAIGDMNTLTHAERFFNIVMTFLDTALTDPAKKTQK